MGALFVGYAASLAILLTAIGLYGILAFAVSRRTKEIGIRLALGAGRGRVIRSIVREGVIVALAGAVVGVVLAIGTSRVLSHLLTVRPRQTGCSTPQPPPSSPVSVSVRRWCRRVGPLLWNQ